MQRHAVGLLALILLTAGLAGLFVYGVADDRTSMYLSICIRIGMVLAAIWLAFPQLLRLTEEFSPWMVGMLALCGIVVILRPRSIVVIGPLMLVLGTLYFIGWLLNKK